MPPEEMNPDDMIGSRPELGADPEFFIWDRGTDTPVPAHKVFSKTPQLILGVQDVATVFRDGYAIELNVRPLLCLAAYNNAVKKALHAVNQMVADKNPAWTIMAAPAVQINLAEDMKGAPLDVMEFGCEAAVDAYTGRPTVVTINAMEHPWRYAWGAHAYE